MQSRCRHRCCGSDTRSPGRAGAVSRATDTPGPARHLGWSSLLARERTRRHLLRRRGRRPVLPRRRRSRCHATPTRGGTRTQLRHRPRRPPRRAGRHLPDASPFRSRCRPQQHPHRGDLQRTAARGEDPRLRPGQSRSTSTPVRGGPRTGTRGTGQSHTGHPGDDRPARAGVRHRLQRPPVRQP